MSAPGQRASLQAIGRLWSHGARVPDGRGGNECAEKGTLSSMASASAPLSGLGPLPLFVPSRRFAPVPVISKVDGLPMARSLLSQLFGRIEVGPEPQVPK